MRYKRISIATGLLNLMPFVLGHEEDELVHMTGMAVSQNSAVLNMGVIIILIALIAFLAYSLLKKSKKNVKRRH